MVNDLENNDDLDTVHETITKGALSRFTRIDERTKAIQDDLRNFREDVRIAITNLMDRIKETELRDAEKITTIQKAHLDLADHLEKHFVKKESFSPIQALVYGFVALVITSVLGAIFSLVIMIKH